ncbi:anti-sigma factor domain-containing protein [Bordetella tumulicola]|uniref:anti-sigma factor n=1 Tax=Bordetella tumulicola TaxID=1649133 RepID=UPI0039F0A8AE
MTTLHDNPPDDLDALAGEYVLGTLPAEQRRQVQANLPHDAALRTAVLYWEERLLPLADLAAPVQPSSGLWLRIQGSLADPAPTVSSRRGTRPWAALWANLPFWRGLSAAGVVAAALLAALLLFQPAGMPPQYVVVLVAPQSQAPGWVIQAQANDAVQLVPLGRTQVPPGRALEFWTKADDWPGPVSLGLVQPGQTIRIPLDKLPPLVPDQLFELTLEPETGSPIGRPTGPIQFIGRAVKVM